MANGSLPNSPIRNTQSNSPFTPATMRRNGGDSRARRPRVPVEAENAAAGQISAAAGLSVSSLATAALICAGLAAVEAARLALVYEALDGFFADTAGALPVAPALAMGLYALDAGLLLRMFLPSTEWRGMAAWSAIGAWLVATTANSIAVMYAVAGMMDASHQLADVAPAGVAIVLLLLRVLLVGALAWDRRGVISV